MESDEGRNKGIRKEQGRIIKGTMKEAPTKLRASSIPSKIENVIYSNHHKTAFGNSQERFYTRTLQSIVSSPGPGNYNPKTLHGKIDSKKGLGFLASQTKLSRFSDKRNWNPGPGRYEVKMASSRMRSQSTAILSTSIQNRELFKNQMRSVKDNPGPGNYQGRMFRSNSAAAQVFNSKNKRFIDIQSSNPGVGQYNWQVVKNKIKSLKFASKTSSIALVEEKSYQKKYYNQILGETTDPAKEIGPGKYNPSLMQTKKTFSIKEDHQWRYRELMGLKEENNEVGSMGPSGVLPSKKVNSHNSVFKSKQRRYEFGQIQSRFIGDPWRYSPSKNVKMSHLLNFGKKWV